MSDTKNVKLGPCVVTFDGNDLGLTKGGVEVDVTTETHPVTVDQFGETVISEFITKRNVKVVCPLAETTVDNLISTMPGAELSQGGGLQATGTFDLDTASITGTSSLVDNVSAIEVNGVTLVFIPATESPNDWQIQKPAAGITDPGDQIVTIMDNIVDAVNVRNKSAALNKVKIGDVSYVDKSMVFESVKQGSEYNGIKIAFGQRAHGKLVFNTTDLINNKCSVWLNGVKFSFRNNPDPDLISHVKIDTTSSTAAAKVKNTLDGLLSAIQKVIDRGAKAADGSTENNQFKALNKAYYSLSDSNLGLSIYHKTIGTAGNDYTVAFEYSGGDVTTPAGDIVNFVMGAETTTGNTSISSFLFEGTELSVGSGSIVLDGGIKPSYTGATVKTAIGVNLLDTARELVLHPADNEDDSEDFVIPLAATAGALKFAYKHNEERIFNVEFMGYPDPATKVLFKLGNITA